MYSVEYYAILPVSRGTQQLLNGYSEEYARYIAGVLAGSGGYLRGARMYRSIPTPTRGTQG
jgi:hypothetical protein